MSWAELFYPKPVKADDLARFAAVRDCFAKCAAELESVLPEGRYKAMVKSELEKTAMLASKAFTHP